jgi:hypothetical protein
MKWKTYVTRLTFTPNIDRQSHNVRFVPEADIKQACGSNKDYKSSLRQQVRRKALHAAGHAILMPLAGCVVKMISSRDCLAPSGNDLDDGGDEQGGDCGYRQCLAHSSPLSKSSKSRSAVARQVLRCVTPSCGNGVLSAGSR